jgi:hypothetical protein
MDMLEALNLCKGGGHRVRPVVWRDINPRHWIEARTIGVHTTFVEFGTMEEMAHALRLQHDTEFLGEWEVVE